MRDHCPKELHARDYWDSQLKFSAILPDFSRHIQQMVQDSASYSHGKRFECLATGTHPRQWVEWLADTGSDSAVPMIIPVIIHGGYWRAMRAEDHRFMMSPWLNFAPAVASIEYRLKPEHRLSDCIDDVMNGLKRLKSRFTAHQFLLIGHSAGGHMAVYAAQDPELAKVIRGVIALSGVFDLRLVSWSSLQDEIGLHEEEITAFTLRPSPGRPPTLYVNGADETHEMIRASVLMASQGKSRALLLPEADHMTLTWAVGEYAESLYRTLDNMSSDRPQTP